MTVLVFGAAGQIGWALQKYIQSFANPVMLSRATVDFRNLDQLRDAIRHYRPTIIVNAAAFTAVDQAEIEPLVAHAVNYEAICVIAEESIRAGSWLVHYSSDYVFDGKKKEPYFEDDDPNPLNVYGITKSIADKAVAEICSRYSIIRASWIYSLRRKNFPLAILNKAMSSDHLEVVSDCFGSPTNADLIADITVQILRAVNRSVDMRGTFNVCASGETSWHNCAVFIIEQAIQHGIPIKVGIDQIKKISQHDFHALAVRPQNSCLSTKKIEDALGLTLPPWEQGIRAIVAEFSEMMNSHAPSYCFAKSDQRNTEGD